MDREPIATAVVREGVTLFLPQIVPVASPRMLAPEYRSEEELIRSPA